jgi:hypothetical protein
MISYVTAQLLKNNRSILYSGHIAFILSILIFCQFISTLSLITIFLLSICICLFFIHQYLAFRIQFDYDLIKDSKINSDTAKELDQVLIKLNLRNKENLTSWNKRLSNCIKYFKFQFIIFSLQCLVLLFLCLNLTKS